MRTPVAPAVKATGEGAVIVPLAQRPQYRELRDEVSALEELYAAKSKERQRLLARARGEKVKRSASERAADLLAGGRIDPTKPGPAIEALDEELNILQGAIIEKSLLLDATANDLSFEESQKLKPVFDQAMRDALVAMEQLADAFKSAVDVADQLRRAGYRPSAVLLPDLIPDGARALGHPAVVGFSQSWQFRRALEDRGIV